MAAVSCSQPLEFETLVAYWLGELTESVETQIEEHLFACGHCMGQLERLAALAAGVRAAMWRGAVQVVITQPFLDELRRQGMRIREYCLMDGQSVDCTIRADDDAVVGRLSVPLAGVTRLDALERLDLGDGHVRQTRLVDVPFDPDTGAVLSLPAASVLRRLPRHTLRIQLMAVEEAGDRLLGEYTFEHTPG